MLNFVNNDNFELKILSNDYGADITQNKVIMSYIGENIFFNFIIRMVKESLPLFKFGSGNPKIGIVSGVHGNELPPQIASMFLIEKLMDVSKIKGTIYIVPFASPAATMTNVRRLNHRDMNRSAHIGGSSTNIILNSFLNEEVEFVADFHSTALLSNPGFESVFCSKSPNKESADLARFITTITGSKQITYDNASTSYAGALEDELNINGVPSVTCEVVSENSTVSKGSIERSILQMNAFLKFFDIVL